MTSGLDPIIHPTHRLRICSMLAAGATVEQTILREKLELSPSAASKQIAALVDAGYVRQQRDRWDSRKLWLSLTKKGAAAYQGHIAALREIVEAGSTAL
ncbi:MarR family winged helix-turn-helix transcriptional regulator [Dermacoccaceae bacterium W4C1]